MRHQHHFWIIRLTPFGGESQLWLASAEPFRVSDDVADAVRYDSLTAIRPGIRAVEAHGMLARVVEGQ